MDAFVHVAFAFTGIVGCILVGYPLITALAYGITRSVLQAMKDHETGKGIRNESERTTP